MAVSLKDLQREAEAIQGLCPSLVPSSVPHGYDVEDLWGLAQTEGKAEREALKQCLAAAAAQQAQCGSRCCVCEAAGDPSVSSSTQDDEAHTLRFTTFSHLDFTNKTIKLTGAGFACGHCRALLEPQRFLHFAALRLNNKHPDRVILAQELCAHFAATNQAPEHVQTNPDALALWVQELMCRAYALQVVASNIHGWRLLGPAGEVVKQAAKGTSTRLAKALLEARQGVTSRSQHPAQAISPSHPATSNKKKADSAKKCPREGAIGAKQRVSLFKGEQEEQEEQEEKEEEVEQEEHPFIRRGGSAGPLKKDATPIHGQQQQQQEGHSERKKRSLMEEASWLPTVGSTKKRHKQQQQQQEQQQQQQQQQNEHRHPATPNGHIIPVVEPKRKAKTPGPSKFVGDAVKENAMRGGQEQAGLRSTHKKQTPLLHKKKARLSL
ncbi:hypothetical protein DUNSADRAFT_7322 [Dunaliella salina]|uniref:Uncharacterized protein n=1 Tax=Dunaliella salina TaxID=3046 RepID=A0ABQ7GLP0_DUNSA|nr:hypothetical protein DUNSADRAFT_7322 [Dunaliella salina]|eukprot:KAF5835482.1 hypothetical protein DUNSADRAFT_7322 [Dunaliella salina]